MHSASWNMSIHKANANQPRSQVGTSLKSEQRVRPGTLCKRSKKICHLFYVTSSTSSQFYITAACSSDLSSLFTADPCPTPDFLMNARHGEVAGWLQTISDWDIVRCLRRVCGLLKIVMVSQICSEFYPSGQFGHRGYNIT